MMSMDPGNAMFISFKISKIQASRLNNACPSRTLPQSLGVAFTMFSHRLSPHCPRGLNDSRRAAYSFYPESAVAGRPPSPSRINYSYTNYVKQCQTYPPPPSGLPRYSLREGGREREGPEGSSKPRRRTKGSSRPSTHPSTTGHH